MKIQSQNIYGGSQQFADKIVNHHYNLSANDRKIIGLVEADSTANVDKELLAKNLEIVKSLTASEEEKSKSKGFLKTLFDAGISEVTKAAVRAIITQGSEYIHFQDLIN